MRRTSSRRSCPRTRTPWRPRSTTSSSRPTPPTWARSRRSRRSCGNTSSSTGSSRSRGGRRAPVAGDRLIEQRFGPAPVGAATRAALHHLHRSVGGGSRRRVEDLVVDQARVPNRTARDASAGPSTLVELGERQRHPRPTRTRPPRAAPRPAPRRIASRSASPSCSPARHASRAASSARRRTGAAARSSGCEVDVPRRQREPVGLADRGTRDDLRPDREVARHLADDHDLLRVLLAEIRPFRADQIEQDRHHGRHAIEVAGPRRALQRQRRRRRPTPSSRTPAVDLLDLGREHEVDPLGLAHRRSRASLRG